MMLLCNLSYSLYYQLTGVSSTYTLAFCCALVKESIMQSIHYLNKGIGSNRGSWHDKSHGRFKAVSYSTTCVGSTTAWIDSKAWACLDKGFLLLGFNRPRSKAAHDAHSFLC